MRLRLVITALALFLVGLGAGLYVFTPDRIVAQQTDDVFKAYDPSAFSQALQAGRTVLVHVHAPWCPACARQTPTLQTIAREPAYRDIAFMRVDFDTQKGFLTEHRVPVQSVILVFKEGQPAERIVGVVEAEELRKRVAAAVG